MDRAAPKLAKYLAEVRDRRLRKKKAWQRANWFRLMKWDRTKLSKKDAERARGMLASGKTQAEVAAEFGVTRVCLRRYLAMPAGEGKYKGSKRGSNKGSNANKKGR